MRRDFTTRKRIILGGVILLVAADVVLAGYSWQLSSVPVQQTNDQTRLKLMQADIERAQRIKKEVPKTVTDCEKFEKSLLPGSSASSSISAELGQIVRKSGVRMDDVVFKPTAIPARGMTELVIDSTIAGDYKSIVQFLNNMQRSSNNYIIESLTLAPEGANQGPNLIRLGVHMRTYLRTSA
jgi:hypothetical protein